MTHIVLGLLFIGCRGSEPTPVQPAPVVKTEVVRPAPSKPKLKLPPADHVPYSNPKIMSHEGGQIPSSASSTSGNRARGASPDENNEWRWPTNAKKPTAPNAPQYDANGRRVYRTSELVDDQELSRRLQQRGR